MISSKEGTKRPQGSIVPCLMVWLEKACKEGIVFIGTAQSVEKMDVGLRKLGRF